MTQTVVSIEHLQKHFGKFQALKDITFDVQAGESFLALSDRMGLGNQRQFEYYSVF